MTSFTSMSMSNIMIKPNDIIYVQPNKWKAFKVASADVTSIFSTLTTIAGPFITYKALTN